MCAVLGAALRRTSGQSSIILEKSLASQHRLKVVDWRVVALASVLPPMGIGALRFGQESGSPNTNSTQRYATQRRGNNARGYRPTLCLFRSYVCPLAYLFWLTRK